MIVLIPLFFVVAVFAVVAELAMPRLVLDSFRLETSSSDGMGLVFSGKIQCDTSSGGEKKK